MQKTPLDTEINDLGPSSLDADIFVPINLNWRKKYYGRVLKKRVFAFLLDIFFNSVIIIIVLFLIFTLTMALGGDSLIDWILSSQNIFGFYVISILSVSVFIPLAIMESSKRKGTFGKRIMKIEITDNYGNSISFWRSIWRNILKLLTFYSYCIYGIGLVIQIFTYIKTKKLFHDHFSNTIIGERL